jgi:alcohol dehydrogenase
MEAEFRNPQIPMGLVMSHELEIIGSHGMQAHKYPEMLEMIRLGKLQPEKLIGKTISLEESAGELVKMNNFSGTGVTVIDGF